MSRLLAWALLLSTWPAAAQWVAVTGEAFDMDSDELLYTEHHEMLRVDGAARRHRVTYRDPGGELLAVKILDYATTGFAPEFELRMDEGRYVEGARRQDGEYMLYRQAAGEPRERKAIETGASLVVDAGFDNFVRARIPALAAGETLEFRLATPGALRGFDFRARSTDKLEHGGREALRIRVEPDSLLRWLVEPLTLVYSVDPVQLLVYSGRTNIPASDGGRYDATIRFGPESPISPPDWSHHAD